VGSIYVVRHGQAAFGTDDYDRLTDVGFAQARLLGAYFGARRLRFDAIFTGTLRRQIETAQAIVEAHPALGAGIEPERFPGLDEYHAEAVLEAHLGELPPLAAAGAVRRDPTLVRDHFRLLRDALLAWAENRSKPAGMAAFGKFQEDAVAALIAARTRFPEGHVLVVSSGGPIAAMTAAALNAPAAAAVELNLRIRNSSLSEFVATPRRHHLLSFNMLPHLDTHPDASLITYT
jgi:broad specificity phosphatase PhoE